MDLQETLYNIHGRERQLYNKKQFDIRYFRKTVS